MEHFDVIVVGGGHAGCEGALAASRMGANTLLVSYRIDRIAVLSCNPAFGGTAKGQLVREIDALGGEMGVVTDRTGIHFRMLNRGKGRAVHSPRAQVDSPGYSLRMQRTLLSSPNLRIAEGECAALILGEMNCKPPALTRVTGIVLADGREFAGERVILATGTFLAGVMHFGMDKVIGGRVGDPAAQSLASSLRETGLEMGRLKTGTTPRIDIDSIRYDDLEAQPGDEPSGKFSFRDTPVIQNHVACHITRTNPRTHEIIKNNLDRSPLFTKVIKGIGPRYCPSIEDKVVRFAGRENHQIFLEPEGFSVNRVYPNGISTSLPKDVQEDFVHSIQGLEEARILQYGYAVEYDFVQPTELYPWLETKKVKNLFLAGQINGTSGYEEAGAQGLMAAINAVLSLDGREPLVLSRSEAYIGVLIDDLVTKGTQEPYRLFTSRAEHRLCLRHDNADERLMGYGHRLRLISEEIYQESRRVTELARREGERLEATRFRATSRMEEVLTEIGSMLPQGPVSYAALLRRPEISIEHLARLGYEFLSDDPRVLYRVETDVKYAGYVERHREGIERVRKMEDFLIPPETDFAAIGTLSNEARQKLDRIRPRTLGQASRISGISPADIGALMVWVKKARSRGSL
jgi:tRNA uridine 5-carboxymethylaminomethyl modification enzyme